MQDLFFFQGRNSSAYLYRNNNNTVTLYLGNNRSFEIYQTYISNQLDFSWIGYKVNGTDMKRIKSSGSTDMSDLNEFTFLSPISDLQPDDLTEICKLNSNEATPRDMSISSLDSNNVNYGYIAGIILIFAFALELKIKIPLLINRLFKKETENGVEESDYESMVNVET